MSSSTERRARIAVAPISWGVCEVAGWGLQLPPERVLAEMAELGVHATELGPDGFLPSGPVALRTLLARFQLDLVGGFVPAVLHERAYHADELDRVRRAAQLLASAGADTLVLAVVSGAAGYDARPELDAAQWCSLLAGIEQAAEVAAEEGLVLALHPHVGTLVETHDEVRRVLDGTLAGLCLDTGHLLIGGSDPAQLAREAASRVVHVHLKDVDGELAGRVRAGEVGYAAAVAEGLYRPLGEGDVDVEGVVSTLERSGYRGWYVLEQDVALRDAPGADAGPLRDVRASLEWVRELLARVAA